MRTIHYYIIIIIAAVLSVSCRRDGRQVVSVNEQRAYSLLGEMAQRNTAGDKKGALRLADSILALNPADSTRCWTLCEKSVALVDQGRMSEGLAAGHEALAFAEKTNDTDAQLNMRGAMGIAYRRMGQVDSAIAQYDRGIELAVREKNTEYEIYLDNCAAVLFSENNRFREALRYSEKAEKAALAAGDTIERLSARANIGSIYLRQKKYREVLKAMLPLWDDVAKANYNTLTLKYLSPMLKAYSELGDDKALSRYMTCADKVMQSVSVTSNGALGILEVKAGMMGRKGLYVQQLELLDSIEAASDVNRSMPEERLLSEKARCLWHLGRRDEAFGMMARACAMLDSVKQGDVERSMNEFAVKYGSLEKEMKIEQMKRREAEQQNRILWLAVAVAVLAAAVGLLAYRKRLAAQRSELERRRSYISGLENERMRLARELHDGVCNDMLAVVMLMNADREAAEKQLRSVWSDARRLSHALMPPQFEYATLPETVRAYVNAVSAEENVNITLTIPDCKPWETLSNDVAYELYRIIQESVANALKHGDGRLLSIKMLAEGGLMSVSVENTFSETSAAGGKNGIGKDTVRLRAESIGATLAAGCSDGKYKIEITLR